MAYTIGTKLKQGVELSETEMTQTKRPPLEISHIPKRPLVLRPKQELRLSKRTSHTWVSATNCRTVTEFGDVKTSENLPPVLSLPLH